MLKSNIKQAKSLFNLNKLQAYSQAELTTEDEEVERCYSTTDENYSFNDDYFQKDQNEEVLIEISKRQSKLNDYSSEGVAFASRRILFDWVEKVISLLNLDSCNRIGIYYRFTMIYDFVMEKKFMNGSIITCDKELKKTIVTIFLIAYKLEGHSIGKITITSLINAFLKNLNMNQQRLTEEIRVMEVKILKMLNYDCSAFENNVHYLSKIMMILIKKRFALSNEVILLIKQTMTKMNKMILLDGQSLFDVYPIDNASIALSASVQNLLRELGKEVNDMTKNTIDDSMLILGQIKEIRYLSEELFSYMTNELKVMRIDLGSYKRFTKVFSEVEM